MTRGKAIIEFIFSIIAFPLVKNLSKCIHYYMYYSANPIKNLDYCITILDNLLRATKNFHKYDLVQIEKNIIDVINNNTEIDLYVIYNRTTDVCRLFSRLEDMFEYYDSLFSYSPKYSWVGEVDPEEIKSMVLNYMDEKLLRLYERGFFRTPLEKMYASDNRVYTWNISIKIQIHLTMLALLVK